jgi:hypothetical protein
MRRLKKWLWILAILAVLAGIGYLLTRRTTLEIIVDYWWFSSLEYTLYFFQRLIYPSLVFLVVTVVFFLLFFLNFRIASRFLGNTETVKKGGKGLQEPDRRDIVKLFRTGSMRLYTPLSLVLAILVAIPLYRIWEKTLLYLFAPSTESIGKHLADPFYGTDISFYLFSYPIYTLIQKQLLVIFAILFLAVLCLYWLENRLLNKENQKLAGGALVHLTILVLIVLAIQVWGYFLQQYGLLYMDDPVTVFFGPGFVEMWFYLPLIYLKILFFTLASLALIRFIHFRKGGRLFAGLAIAFLLALGLEHTRFIPKLIDQIIVAPNEMVRQKPYIQNNIDATLDAFDLAAVEEHPYEVRPVMRIIAEDTDVQKSLRNIPVWDRDVLGEVYEERQGIRPYYSFPGVDVDRYTVNGVYQQVNIGAREISVRKLPATSQSWINQRLQYTHGYGAVMNPAAQGGDEDMQWFMRNLPLQSDLPYNVAEPGIYFGMEKYQYAIAPNEQGEVDYPQRDDNAVTDYEGRGGISISNLLKKGIFALYFRERNIFFTTKTTNQSRILIRRNIQVAIENLAPFLLLDGDPYIVAGKDRFFWIQDAYTTSTLYPYTGYYKDQHYESEQFNYIRNSVKIMVDAYHGDVKLYLFDPEDPIVRAYARIYPGLFTPMSEMDPDVRKHIRYPKSLFEIQMSVYTKYHQKSPELFYRQEDHWEFAGVETSLQRSYYMTLDLFDAKSHEFMILSPMSPIGRDNLRSLMIVGCDGENYGRIITYDFPKGQQIYGPAQVSSLIDNDDRISQELSLWDQEGSKIKRGRMIIFPVGNSILYIQPVYLTSTARTQIPRLIRIIISQGSLVEMSTSIEDGFRKLEDRVKEQSDKLLEQTYPPPAPPTEATEEPETTEAAPAE